MNGYGRAPFGRASNVEGAANQPLRGGKAKTGSPGLTGENGVKILSYLREMPGSLSLIGIWVGVVCS